MKLAHTAMMLAVLGALTSGAGATGGSEDESKKGDRQEVSGLTLQELMNLEVTTTSKKAEHLFDVPAAAYVISSAEIRATGARSLPDLLRIVPGITVQQTNSNQWSVASRGFIDTFTNKLLVMIDGRSIYTPTFGGVVWGNQDLSIEDIERIEVIRGPGGSLWGANAVTGVINIITKHTADTLGTYAAAGLGTLDLAKGAFRYGQRIDDESSIRFSLKYKQFDETTRFKNTPEPQNDAGNDRRLNLRYDHRLPNGSLMIQAGASGTHYGQVPYVASETDPSGLVAVNRTYNPSAYFLLGRYSQEHANGAQDSLQAYFDHATRNIIDANEIRDTFDIEAQRTQKLSHNLSAVYGAGFKSSRDETNGTPYFYFVPASKNLQYLSFFGQLESQVTSESKLIGGVKFERNDYTGWEVQPSLRYSYMPDDRHTWWAAVSRSVRTPTRFDRESFDLYYFDSEIPGYNAYIGSSDFKSEKQVAYEAGLKLQPSTNLTLDIAGFFNRYTDLRGTIAGENYPYPGNPSVMVQPNYIVNGINGNTSGVEMYGKWDPAKNWRLYFSYAYFAPDLTFEDGVTADPTISIAYTPRHAASLISDWRLDPRTNFGVGLYWQDGMSQARVKPSVRVDLNLRYQASATTEAVLSLQNASQRLRFEGQTTDFTYASYIPRSLYVGLRTRY